MMRVEQTQIIRPLRRTGRMGGITLIELLLVLAMSTVLAAALTFALGSAIKLQEANEAQQANYSRTHAMEQELERTLEGARLNLSASNPATGSTVTTSSAPTSYFQGLSDGGSSEEGSDRLTFTTTAPGVPVAAMDDTSDFETQQETRGPIGGLSEISIGMTPVGDAGENTGLFERIQRPSDSDPTQGGFESDLDPDIASIGFEFWDGTQWQTSWDTTQMTPPRLPEAVQVTYTIRNEAGSPEHQFVIPIFASDVTPNNPVSSGTSSSAGATTP